MRKLDQFLAEELQKRRDSGLFRTLSTNGSRIDFTSNDYLGLARSEPLRSIIQEKEKEISVPFNGATGSRLLSGNTKFTEELEEYLATIFDTEACLIFNSGYVANLAVLSCLPQKEDTIIYDELAHASIKDGARLSLAKRFSFKHNNIQDLETKIKGCRGRVFIVVESIYSMNGDECKLKEIIAVAKKYDAIIILDEAHSTGVVGASGSGLAINNELHKDIDVRIYTFGKAIGVHGACICGSKNLVQFMVNFARPFIYTTALSPHTLLSIRSAFEYLNANLNLQKDLKKNIELYLGLMSDVNCRTYSESAIQTIIISGNERTREAALTLQAKNFDVRPILSPTVKSGTERLRICLHSYNTTEEITLLTSTLKQLIASD